jgi:hypothetical protein
MSIARSASAACSPVTVMGVDTVAGAAVSKTTIWFEEVSA